jgi:bacteriophage N4 adsorption protein B
MAQSLTAILAVIYHEILLFAVVGLAIGGTDDFLVDIMFLARRWWRNIIIYSRHPRMTTASLPQSENPGRIAIFVPAWGEADVIGPMLRNALSQWRQGDYRIFVGVYPNDRATLDAVIPIAEGEERLIICINERPGPTTKADCLNLQWRTMMKEESRTGVPFKAIVLHDAEDVVHADEIRLFDLMIDRFQLVQLPVLPLPGHGGWWSRAIANHYCDEFADPLARKFRPSWTSPPPLSGWSASDHYETFGGRDFAAHSGRYSSNSQNKYVLSMGAAFFVHL